MEYKGLWAVVTGASAGIGEEFARQLARRGANVVLIARRKKRLELVAGDLSGHGGEMLAIAEDLSDPEAPGRIKAILHERGIQVSILVNNAGFGMTGDYLSRSWEEHQKFIELMITSYGAMVHMVMPDMVEDRWGRIINVASVAGLVPPAAGHTLYGPSKAFLVSFTQALAAEGKSNGIHVSALCPGFTKTEFHDVNQTREKIDKLPKWMVLSTRPTVDGALKAVERNKTVFVPGTVYKLIVWASMRLPRSLVERLAQRQGKSHRETKPRRQARRP